jgi:hypothetical protein
MTTEMLTTVNSENLCSIDCTHKTYGAGKITKIRCSEYLGKPELFLTFESEVKNTTFAYTFAVKLLELNETDASTLESLMTEYRENWLEFDTNRKAEVMAAWEAEKVAEAKAKADEAAQKKLKATMANLNKMQPEDISATCQTSQVEYETIGWLAKHCTSIKPFMPAGVLDWFEQKFGKVDNAKIYEAEEKTSGKNPMKYTLSIEGCFDSEVPSVLNRYAQKNNPKHINSIGFFWTLVTKYGFQFGRKQNVDEIRKLVPEVYLADFERGLTM